MFSDLFLVSSSLVALYTISKVSFVIEISILVLLTHWCTKYILEVAHNEELNLRIDEGNLSKRYTQRIARFFYSILSSINWFDIIVNDKNIINKSDLEQSRIEPVNNDDIPDTPPPDGRKHCGSCLSLNNEVKTVVDCIMQRYLKSWYHGNVSRSKEFINDVEHVIHDTLLAVCEGVAKLDRKLFVSQIIQLYLHYFYHFKEALDESYGSEFLPEASVIKKKEVIENFKMHHWATKESEREWCYLQSVMSSVLDTFGPVELLSYSMLHSMVTEILTQNILYPMINIVTNPDRLNMWLKNLVNLYCGAIPKEETERESNTSVVEEPYDNSLMQPKILLSQGDSGNLLHSNSSSAEFSNGSSESKINMASNTVLDELRESFESDVCARSGCQSDNISPMRSFGDLSPETFRARSNTSVSAVQPESFTSLSTPSCLDIMYLRRTRSADYIRKMRHGGSSISKKFSFRSFKSSGEKRKKLVRKSSTVPSVDIEVAEEALESEVPDIITDVEISGTELQEDPGHSPYTLYCIKALKDQANGLVLHLPILTKGMLRLENLS